MEVSEFDATHGYKAGCMAKEASMVK